MQRPGFLKYLTYRCSLRDSSSLELLGKELISAGSKKVQTQLTPLLNEYILRRLTDRIYRDLRESIKKSTNSIYMETQDLYLADSQLPSKVGKLTGNDWRKYPYLLSSLGLMRKGTYSLLVRGKVFLELVSDAEIKALESYKPEINPLVLTHEQKALLLYCFIENDGFILKELYSNPNLLALKDFSDRQTGDFLPAIYRKVVKSFNPRARNGEDKDRLQRLLSSAEKIEQWKGKPYTGKGAREDSVTVRLEPLVDLGLLQKKDPYTYRYSITKEGRKFFRVFCQVTEICSFLKDAFFKTLNNTFSLKATPLRKHSDILSALFKAYEQIKSPLGYAPIKEIALLAAIKSLFSEKRYFEIGKASKLIMKYQKSHPNAIRFQVNRAGTPVYVKFSERV